MRPRRWKVWRIDRGEGAVVWQGAEGPATNPPEDCGLRGMDWIDAAMVEAVEVLADPERVEAITDVLFAHLSLEDEDGQPAAREHYFDIARQLGELFPAPQPNNEQRYREALEEIVRIYNDDPLSNWEDQDRTGEIASAALKEETPDA